MIHGGNKELKFLVPVSAELIFEVFQGRAQLSSDFFSKFAILFSGNNPFLKSLKRSFYMLLTLVRMILKESRGFKEERNSVQINVLIQEKIE